MNVSCTSCSAKYGIPDEKVRGKKVKITCKHCGTAIVVDGTTLDAATAAPAAAATAAPAAASPAPAPIAAATPAPAPAAAKVATAPAPAAAKVAATAALEELSFDIAYPDDRQETLKLSELVGKYQAGTLGDDTFVWREGMSDWKAPREVPEIESALTAKGANRKAAAPAPQSYEDDEATKIQVSPFDVGGDDPSGEWREPAKEAPSSPQAPFDLRAPSALPFEKPEVAATSPKPAATSPKPAAASPKPAAVAAKPEAEVKPTAARRSAARGGGDLFGDLAAAGSEDDESLGTDAKEAAPKLTGARNESSVLFSLDSLVKQEQKTSAKKPAPKQDDSALLLGNDSSPNSIANVGTGSFGSAFAAPDFNAPVTAVPEVRAADPVDAYGAPPKKKGAGLWIGIIAVLALGGGAAAMVLSGKLAGTPPSPAPTNTAAAKPEMPPAPSVVEPSPPTTAEAPNSAAPVAGSASAAAAGGASHAGTGGAAAAVGAAAKPADAATKPTEATTKPAEAATKPAEKPAEKPAAEASDAPPFDTAAAKAALGAAAGNAGSCKTPDGPTGNGKVSVTFMPSGRATNTQVSGDLAGTAVGGCVAKLFRSAKVPPFSGDPVTVSKSFAVQ